MRPLGERFRRVRWPGVSLSLLATPGCCGGMSTLAFCQFSTTDFLVVADSPQDSGETLVPAYLLVSQTQDQRETCDIRLADVEGEGFTLDSQPVLCQLRGVAEDPDPESFTLWYGLLWDHDGTLESAREDDFPLLTVRGGPVAELWNGWELDLVWGSMSYGCM